MFQTNNPIVHFLEKSLVDVFQPLLKMVVKPDVLKEADTDLRVQIHELQVSIDEIRVKIVELRVQSTSYEFKFTNH